MCLKRAKYTHVHKINEQTNKSSYGWGHHNMRNRIKKITALGRLRTTALRGLFKYRAWFARFGMRSEDAATIGQRTTSLGRHWSLQEKEVKHRELGCCSLSLIATVSDPGVPYSLSLGIHMGLLHLLGPKYYTVTLLSHPGERQSLGCCIAFVPKVHTKREYIPLGKALTNSETVAHLQGY